MNILLIILIVIIIIVLVAIVAIYNGLVTARNKVKNAWAQIDVQLNRRADLIPNLVNTVKAYATHEEDVYTALADARARLNSASTPEEYKEATDSFDSALSRLLVVVENYPELKADKNFVADYPYIEVDSALESVILRHRNCVVIKNLPDYETNKNVNTPTNRVLTSMLSRERILFLLRYGVAYVNKSTELEDGTKVYNELKGRTGFTSDARLRTSSRGMRVERESICSHVRQPSISKPTVTTLRRKGRFFE